jgi:secreted trypsin-like serine protease
MYKIFLLLFSLIQFSLQFPSNNNRIIGGRDADISEFPFIARSFFKGRAWCGNVIINEFTLISAAHCYENRNASDFTILAGETDVRNNQSAISVREVIFYPDFVSFLEHDIVVLKLNDSLPPWSEEIQPARLPTENYQPLDGTELSVSGEKSLVLVLVVR